MATASAKTVVLIMSANWGIGFDLAAQLMAKGSYHILAGTNSFTAGQAAIKNLESRELPGSIELVQIDNSNDNSIGRAATTILGNHARLDMLVNHGGIGARATPLRKPMQEAFERNVIGPAVVTRTFAPLLQKSSSPLKKIVSISNGANPLMGDLDPSSDTYKGLEIQYRTTKAALSMLTACQWAEYGPDGIKVFGYDPGFVMSHDLLKKRIKAENGIEPPSEAVVQLIDVLEGKRDDEAGKLLHNTDATLDKWVKRLF